MKFFSLCFSFRQTIFKKFSCQVLFKHNFKSWNIVFFGSDGVSLTSLKELNKNENKKFINSLEIVTINNSTPVYEYAVDNNFKVQIWPPVLSGPLDFGIIVSFGKFIPKELLDIFPLGIINVHTSLLPRWRGGMPITHCLKNGDAISGITIIKINCNKFDSGDIIYKKSVSVGENELMPSLRGRLAKVGSECLMKVIKEMPDCLEKTEVQSNEGVTSAPKIKKEEAIVKWDEMSALEVYNLYRALFSTFDLKTTWQGISVKLLCISLNKSGVVSEEQSLPGSVHFSQENQRLVVQCKENSIHVCTLKLRGKLYGASNFNRGFLTQITKSLRRFGT